MDEFTDLGGKLKQVREARGISLEDVQAQTKIPIDVLRSIEREEKVRNLSPIYLKGFLKIYAKFLGVEISSPAKNYPAKPSSAQTRVSNPKKEEFKSSFGRGIDYSSWIKIAAVFVVLIALIFFAVKLSQKIKSRPAVAKATKVLTAKSAAAKPAATASQPSKASQIKLTIRAKQDSWVSVKRDGKLAFRGNLRKGSSESWIAKEKFELSINNASALELSYNDKIISPLGKKAQKILITKEGYSVQK